MERTNNFREQQGQNLDKTLDENHLGNLQMSVSNQSGMVNPYTQTGGTSTPLTGAAPSARLPDGNEPIPLGSGVIAGTLGEGGMARVYRVWNEKLELYRAVKVLLPTERPELMERFETEIKISAKLHHPNIVETYTVGDWNGLPYIEMELVEGVSLEYLIREYGKIPMAVCAAIGAQVADALSYAHTQQFLIYGKTYNGIIHRDLKPANIMIGKNGVVKLMDFGIARPSEVGLHTVAGNIVGTLPYLSPEQLDESDIDQRSDIYSLGTIIYEALTGEKTFPQQTVTNLMRMKIINSYRKFDSFTIDISSQLSKAVEKCLSQDKNERYATARELKDALVNAFGHLSSVSQGQTIKQFVDDPFSFETKMKKNCFKVKHLKTILISAGAVVVVGVLAAVLIAFPPKSPDEKKVTDANNTAKVTTPVGTVPSLPERDTVVIIERDTVIPKGYTALQPVPKLPSSSGVRPVIKPIPATTAPSVNTPVRDAEPTIESLMKKYNETDVVAIADAACKSSTYTDAVLAIENMPSDHPKKEKGNILLAYAYLEQGKISKASSLIESFSSEDAYYVLLEGRVAMNQGKDKRALDKFEYALTRPSSVRNISAIRNDALYYTAIVYDNRYSATLSPESRQQALMAWNTLKRMYISQPDHPRFKLANQKLASF